MHRSGSRRQSGCRAFVPMQVRNLILSRWRSDVSRFMSEKQALAGLPKKDKPYGLAAWHFLHSKCTGTVFILLLLAEGKLADTGEA